MRIALRTSGGRGEYELAGHQASTSASSLLGKELDFQIRPGLVIPGLQAADRVQGKPRIRLANPSIATHAYRFLAGTLILPKPKRELHATGTGENFVRNWEFAVSGIDVDVVSSAPSRAILQPTALLLENASGSVRVVDVPERMALIQQIWTAASGRESRLAELVGEHEEAVLSGDHKRIERASASLQKAVPGNGDLVNTIAAALAVEMEAPPGPVPASEAYGEEGEDDETDPLEAARTIVSKWRRTVQRTAAARKFSEHVREAYKSRCVVCGKRLPRLASASSSGVAGAHILPWAKYDLNTVKNGLCLDQLCHWAFDAGVIRLDWDGSNYVISIPEHIQTEAQAGGFDIEYFEQFVGPIATDRLPEQAAQRPSPNYLALLAKEMYG